MYPPPHTPVPLRVGPTPGHRAGVGCLTALAAVWTLLLVGLAAVGLLTGDLTPSEAIGGGLLVLIPTTGLLVGLAALVSVRSRTWLEGPVLVQRRLFATRRLDLAAAQEIYADSVPEYRSTTDAQGESRRWTTGRRLPLLVIREASGLQVRLPLTGNGLLPPDALTALADAISAGVRPEPYESRARATADWLRTLANDPQARML